jgi:hypothetical protein
MDKLTFVEIVDAIKPNIKIRWIDFDLGQLEQETPPIAFPCVLIGLGSSPIVSNSGRVDQVSLQITIRVAFRLFERTHSVTADMYRDAALTHLDMLRDVHAQLNGLTGTNFSALTRTQYWSNEKRADIRVYQCSYGTILEDDGTDTNDTPGGGHGPVYVPWSDLTPFSPDLLLDQEVAGYDGVNQPPKVLTTP